MYIADIRSEFLGREIVMKQISLSFLACKNKSTYSLMCRELDMFPNTEVEKTRLDDGPSVESYIIALVPHQ